MAAAAGHTISPATLSATVRNVSATAIVCEFARSGTVAAVWSHLSAYQSAIIGFWALFNGQTVGLGVIFMCGFLLLTFVYLPAKDMSKEWSRNY